MTRPSLSEYVDQAHGILHEAITRYQPSHVFGLFSGGHDSLCATHIAAQHPRFTAAVHINTGIGIEETRQFVRETCQRYGWPLIELHPPISYEQLVIAHGFPGPAHHYKMYQRLKERCLRQLFREHGTRREKLVLVSGIRADESRRRFRVTQQRAAIQEGPYPSKRAIWTNVLLYWSTAHKASYIECQGLPRNRVAETLCMSGECLCGAFAQPGELEMLRVFYPAAAAEIDRIAARVAANGQHARWGMRPPTAAAKREADLAALQGELPLCWSCEAKHAAMEAHS